MSMINLHKIKRGWIVILSVLYRFKLITSNLKYSNCVFVGLSNDVHWSQIIIPIRIFLLCLILVKAYFAELKIFSDLSIDKT